MGMPFDVVWQRRLRERSLTYWRLVTWHTVTRHIRLHDLHPAYRQAMVDLVRAATEGERNALACKVVELTPRFESVMTYLATHRRLPGSPVLSLEPDGLIILAGGHRMAAYFYCRGDISARASAHLPMPPDAIQRYWIGAPHALLVPVMFPSEDRIDVPHEAQGAM